MKLEAELVSLQTDGSFNRYEYRVDIGGHATVHWMATVNLKNGHVFAANSNVAEAANRALIEGFKKYQSLKFAIDI